jgi:hypothetical protein
MFQNIKIVNIILEPNLIQTESSCISRRNEDFAPMIVTVSMIVDDVFFALLSIILIEEFRKLAWKPSQMVSEMKWKLFNWNSHFQNLTQDGYSLQIEQ